LTSDQIREKIESTLETEGFAEITSIFPQTFSDDDIKHILESELSLSNIVVEEQILISKTFLEKCVNKLKDKFVELIELQAQEALGKGKSKSKKKADESCPLTEADVLSLLEKRKVMEYIVEDSERESFMKHLMPMVSEAYTKTQEELKGKQNAASTDIITELNTKIEYLGLGLIHSNRSIKNLLVKNSQINESKLEVLGLCLAKPIIEKIIQLNMKKFSIPVDKGLLNIGTTAESS
jgi:hypothetical protein